MDTTMSYEVLRRFQEVEARLDALEANVVPSDGDSTSEPEETEEEI